MALHLNSCNCEACQESPMGFPAFSYAPTFPSPEHWTLTPMKQDRWGMTSPWMKKSPFSGKRRGKKAFSGAFTSMIQAQRSATWTPADFGQSFVPGTVLPPLPASAFDPSAAPGPIFQPPGLPSNPTAALAQLTASGQGPSSTTGISPTLSLAEAQAQAADQGMNLNSDGTLSAISNAGISPAFLIGGALLLLLL